MTGANNKTKLLEIARSVGLMAALATGPSFAPAHAATIAFEGDAGGTFSYDGAEGVGTLMGSAIPIARIVPLDTAANDGTSLNCVGCTLSFSTGKNLTEDLFGDIYVWTFDGAGGTVTLTGGAETQDPSPTTVVSGASTLVSGTWSGPVTVTWYSSLSTGTISGSGASTLHGDLLSYYGSSGLTWSFSDLSNIASSFIFDTSTRSFSGSASNTSLSNSSASTSGGFGVPEPASLLLFGLGLLGLAAKSRGQIP